MVDTKRFFTHYRYKKAIELDWIGLELYQPNKLVTKKG